MKLRTLPAMVFLALSAAAVGAARGEALERLKPERLRATHQRVLALREERRPVALDSGYQDVRAALHVHSALSHDSRAPLEEIIAGAKAAGVRVVMFTEHPADHYDYFADGHAGLVDDVLLIPGAETEGFLAFPTRSLRGEQTAAPQDFVDLVRRDGGLVFLSHIEERPDWRIRGLTGAEIYNTHADFKDETKFIAALRNPLTLVALVAAVRDYPQETFAAIQDHPSDYLRVFDEQCRSSRLTGVAANDAHHNQSFRLRITDAGALRVDDALGKKLVELDPQDVPLIRPLLAGHRPGEVLFEIDLDPYERSFRHASTHLWLSEVTRASVWDALRSGRAYVAFDWMADPTGFVLFAEQGSKREISGSEITLAEACADGAPAETSWRLRSAAPQSGTFKLLRDGQVIATRQGAVFDEPLDAPGVYRVEVWLDFAGEPRPWILSNPLYVRAAGK